LPFLYPCLNDLHDLDDLQWLEMKASRDAAEVTNVITNAKGEIPVDDMVASGSSAGSGTDTGSRRSYYESTVGGRTVVLQTGDTFGQFRIDRPSEATRSNWVILENKVCAGVGIPRQLVYPESIQGTVERSILDMAASWFAIRSAVLADQFRRLWEYVLSYGTQTEIELSDPPANWRLVAWKAPRAVNVDVGRNSTAMLAELAAGVRTRAQIWAEVGRDWRIETRQKAIEEVFLNELAAEYNLPVERIASAALPPATAGPSPEEFEPVPITR
jgi:capsid protein